MTGRTFPRDRPALRPRPRILVAGLGNLRLKDDGVGVHAVRALQRGVPRGVRTVEVGRTVLDALPLIEWADQILAIDAMRVGDDPGTIYRGDVEDATDRLLRASLHEVALLGALRVLMRGPRPPLAVLGVEPETIDTGVELSPSVQAALPQVIAAARDLVTRWSA